MLEGVLLYRVQANPAVADMAVRAPRDRQTGAVLPFDKWALEGFIEVAHEVGWVDREIRDFTQALRSYRNLVHPRRHVAEGIYPAEGTCNVCWAATEAALAKLLTS